MAQYKVAIVGAGPAGYFTAQALQNSQNEALSFSVDMIERLPTMWGLVRSGVAPDHPKIKTVAKVFEKVASDSKFRLFGNVELGIDLQMEDLTSRYDAVVLCTGSSLGKTLGIPGEDLPGSISAAEFVPWYNGHPDYVNVSVPLDGAVAVVIGGGNVAMDCARILAIAPSELDSTDTADHALAALHASNIRQVYVSARRGPEHAAFTSPELRDLPKLEHTDVFIGKNLVDAAMFRAESEGEIDKQLAANLEAMRAIADTQKVGHERSMEFQFLATPKEIKGNAKVEEVIFGINEFRNGTIVETGETFSIRCSLVITAIGYYAEEIPGINFEKGRVKNDEGRVLDTNVYTVGWAKRGPSGVIGTNKSDATDVVKLIIEDLKIPKESGDITQLLPAGHLVIDQVKWAAINSAEIAAGEATGRPRIKEVVREKLLRLGQA